MKDLLKKVSAFIVLVSFSASLFANNFVLAAQNVQQQKSHVIKQNSNNSKITESAGKIITVKDGGIGMCQYSCRL